MAGGAVDLPGVANFVESEKKSYLRADNRNSVSGTRMWLAIVCAHALTPTCLPTPPQLTTINDGTPIYRLGIYVICIRFTNRAIHWGLGNHALALT